MSNAPHSQEDAFGTPPAAGKRRYYFDVFDGETLTRDETGVELDGLDTAQQEASGTLGEIARDALPDGVRRDFVIDVRDETGRIVLRATLALTIERP